MSRIAKYRLLNGDRQIGTFEYGTTDADLRVTLVDGLTHLDFPIDFLIEYEKGNREYSGKIVKEWIFDRVTPANRCNIEETLTNLGLERYDEMDIFLKTDGKHVCDSISIELLN